MCKKKHYVTETVCIFSRFILTILLVLIVLSYPIRVNAETCSNVYLNFNNQYKYDFTLDDYEPIAVSGNASAPLKTLTAYSNGTAVTLFSESKRGCQSDKGMTTKATVTYEVDAIDNQYGMFKASFTVDLSYNGIAGGVRECNLATKYISTGSAGNRSSETRSYNLTITKNGPSVNDKGMVCTIQIDPKLRRLK